MQPARTIHCCRQLKTEYLDSPNSSILDPSKTRDVLDLTPGRKSSTFDLSNIGFATDRLALGEMHQVCLKEQIRNSVSMMHRRCTMRTERKLYRAMRVRGFVWNTLYALGLVVVISQAGRGGAAQALPTSFIHSEVYSLPTPPP